MKYTGIWIDNKKAHLVVIDNKAESFKTIESKVERFKPKGGSGTRFKSGPQDVVHDSKYLEREKHQLKQYFKNVTSEIGDTNALVIFGPADTNLKLNAELNKNYPNLASKVKGVIKADSMTDNQIKALVKDFFELN